MTLKLPTGATGDFKRVPPGTHIAICNMVADCGLQPGSAMYPKPARKLYVRFEIPGERIEYERDGVKSEGPMTIGSFYTASMNEKARLRKHLESWRGRSFTDEQAAEFDVSSILGKPCMLNVIEEVRGDRTYSNIASIGSLPKGVPALAPENTPLYFGPESPSSDAAKLPDWLREKIDRQLAPEVVQAKSAAPEFDDEIPFS